MSTKVYPYRYNKQFARYIGQFMRVLSGFQVQDGVERDGEMMTTRVPVVYGGMSRIVASILNKRDKLNNPSLPIIGVNLQGIEIDPMNRRSAVHRDEISTKNVNVPEGKKVVQRIFGPSFMLNMDASIYASSTSELFQILEQILLIFNPRVRIQVDTDAFNSDFISEIILLGISPDIQYPIGTESTEVMMSLSFAIPARLNYPRGYNDNVIDTITANIKEGDEIENADILQDIVGGP